MDGPPLAAATTRERLPARRVLVQREPLFQRLSAAGPGGVMLLCAPAGSGKTALLRSWVEAVGWERVAWVSVERGERDGQRFWLALVEALAGAVSGAGLVERVSPSPGFSGELLVERLLSELGSLDEPVLLVIDDLHELRSTEAVRWLELCVARLPAQLRLALATRQDPRLGLHRLRLADKLTELRGTDLRFSLEEAHELLEAAGIVLSDEGLALLHERTEGWAAGLRLAAVSLAEHPDPELFVTEFCGSERTVAGYLLAEVLERQPADVRKLLLRTSVLERVSGPLADFLTGGSGSEWMLRQLEDANAFVSSLDAGRSWFRYHHLFADLLRLELRRVAPEIVGPLHRAAARWHAEQGDVVEAIRHAQLARDWPDAIRLLADSEFRLILDGRRATIRALLAAFPAEEAAADAELALACGIGRALDGLLDDAAAYVTAAERLAPTVRGDRRWYFDLRLSSVRLLLARRGGDLNKALDQVRSVEASLSAPPKPHRANDVALAGDARVAALMNLGIAELWSLRLDDARSHLEQVREHARRIGRPYLEIGCLAHLAMAAPLGGLPATVALPFTERAVAIAETHGWATDPIAAAAFAAGASVLVRLARFEEAERWLQRAERALDPGEPGTELVLHATRGLLRLAQGRLEEALAALRASQEMQARLADEHALTIELGSRALQAQIRMGDTAAARAALAEMPAQERERAEMHIAAASVHLADDNPRAAVDALAPVIERKVRALHPTWAAIEASVLGAAAHEQLGDRRTAEESIERALELAEPDGMILPFVLTPVGDLLARHPRHRTAHATLLTTILDLLAASRPPGQPPRPADELSDAELRVLRYLPSNLKAPEIASELCVSANTVRTHLRHIYAKLGAHNRSEAVARGREQRLLGPRAAWRGDHSKRVTTAHPDWAHA
jgi:LuxR family transcriptional regulator, maltose regulon positive regulatory protein